MYSTKIYLYNQRHTVTIFGDSLVSTGINLPRTNHVYSENLKAVKGVDTTIEFQFLDQNQKPINLENTTLTFKLIRNNIYYMNKALTIVVASKGKAKITLTALDLTAIESQRANYSIERTFNSLTELAYVDDNTGTQGVIDILPQVIVAP
jgi:hypothetical protein